MLSDSEDEGDGGPPKAKKAIVSDDEGGDPPEEKNTEGEPEETANEVVPDVSEDSDDDRPTQ